MKKRDTAAIGALVLGACAGLTGCDIFAVDNYDSPNATLTGQVVYDGRPIGVRSGGVELELWQPGFELSTKIPVHVAHDGSFSASLFEGDYEINLLAGNGPWLDNGERRQIAVRGTTEVEVLVVPYYTIDDEAISNQNGVIQATFRVGEVDSSRAIEYVGVYVGTTMLVDRTNMAVRTEVQGSDLSPDTPLNLSVELPESIWVRPGPGPREEVWVRIGVKTVGVAEMLFSQIQSVGI